MNRNKTSRKSFLKSGVLAIICSISVSLTIYLLFLQTPLLSKREILAALILFLVCVFPSYYLIDRFLLPHFNKISPRAKIALIISSFIFGIFIVSTTNYPKFLFCITQPHCKNPDSRSSREYYGGTNCIHHLDHHQPWRCRFLSIAKRGGMERDRKRDQPHRTGPGFSALGGKSGG